MYTFHSRPFVIICRTTIIVYCFGVRRYAFIVHRTSTYLSTYIRRSSTNYARAENIYIISPLIRNNHAAMAPAYARVFDCRNARASY